MAKKYYWLQLKENFFLQPKIKKLRRIAGGDTYTVIYLKLQLLSLKNEGDLYFEGIEDNFIDELALTIDEDVENVKFTVMYLINQHLLEEVEKDEFSLPEAKVSIGTESESTQRVRRLRERRKEEKSVTCNGDVTKCNTEIEIELKKELEPKKDKELKKTKFELSIDLISTLEPERQLILKEWLEYKKSKNQNYAEVGLKKLISTIEEFSDLELKTALDSSISNNYAGLFPKHMNKPKNNFYRADANTSISAINKNKIMSFGEND